MKLTRSIMAVLCAAALLLLPGCSKREQVFTFNEKEPEMAAAISAARANLPDFWRVFAKPEHGESKFSLAVRVKDQSIIRHFWLTHIERVGDKVLGTIDSDVGPVTNVKAGDRIEIHQADIVDWLYMRDGKMVGNYTVRVFFKQMSPREVEYFKGIMASP